MRDFTDNSKDESLFVIVVTTDNTKYILKQVSQLKKELEYPNQFLK